MLPEPVRKPGEGIRYPLGIDEEGIGHVWRTDTDGRLELVLKAGLGINRRLLYVTVEGDLEVGSLYLPIPNESGADLTIRKVRLDVATAPVGAAIILDFNVDGTTIFTTQGNRPQVEAGALTGDTEDIDLPTWGNGSLLTVDLDQVGSSAYKTWLVATVVLT